MAELTKKQIEEFKQEEKVSENSSDYRNLAEKVAEAGDKVYAMELYKKSEELATSGLDYCYLAHSVAEESYINDKNYAIKILEKAESDPGSFFPRVLRDVGEIYCHQINDKSKAREVFEKCEKLIDTWEPAGILRPYWNEEKGQQLIYLADKVSGENGLDDKEYARELYKKAEYYISSRGFDASELAGYLEDFDEEWSKNVRNGNYGTQDTLDETNDTKSEGNMKLKLQLWVTLITERLHEIEIDPGTYPELKGKTTGEIKKYIDKNMWEMKPVNDNSAYESLGEELTEGDFIGEEIPAPEYGEIDITISDN